MVDGGSSWQDLGLYLIARLTSLERALQVAKIYLIDWYHVGQQPYSVLTCHSQSEDPLIADCQAWLGRHYDESHPVRGMTRLSGMSPMGYVQAPRLEEAKQYPETGGGSGHSGRCCQIEQQSFKFVPDHCPYIRRLQGSNTP